MRERPCPRETETARAARHGGSLPAPLREHVERCADCQEVLHLTARLVDLGRRDSFSPAGSAGRIWWKAEIVRQRAAVRRAETPVRIAEAAGAVGGLGVLVAWIAWNRHAAWTWLCGLAENASLTGAPSSLPAAALLLSASAVAVTAVVLALRPFLAGNET